MLCENSGIETGKCDVRRLRMRTCGSCDLSFPCSGALRTIELFRVVLAD